MKQTLCNRRKAKFSFFRIFRILKKDERGVTAVEFALILPILLITYMGTIEISQGLTVSRNTTNIASTVADLIGQRSDVTGSDLDMIFQASRSIISPFTSGNVQIIASSYCRKAATAPAPAKGDIVRDWMRKYQADGGSDIGDTDNDDDESTSPTSITETNTAIVSLLPNDFDSVIVAETQYHYDFISPASAIFKLFFGSSNKFGNATGPNGRGSFTLRDRFFVRPRNARKVHFDGKEACDDDD